MEMDDEPPHARRDCRTDFCVGSVAIVRFD